MLTELSSQVLIRDIASLEEVRAVEELQKDVWGLEDLDITPLTHLVAARECGGQLVGAFDDHTLAGFVYGFVGVENARTIHHSQMLAVRSAYRGLDVGYRLKLAQRERVLAQGITRITWTFDPLQSLNAHFNFCKLGVVSDSYKTNFYGEESSSFLHSIGTDRLWLTWMLEGSHVRQRMKKERPAEPINAESPPLIHVEPDGSPGPLNLHEGLTGERAFIEIPADINALQRQSPDLAVLWRESTRRAFTEALTAGFLVESFSRQTRGERSVGVYLLNRGRTIEDFA